MSKTSYYFIMSALVTILYFSSSRTLYKDDCGVVYISNKVTSFQSDAILVLPYTRNCKVHHSSSINTSYFPDALVNRLNSSLAHTAEPFLRSRQLCSYSRTSQNFMNPESSLPCSLEPFTGPYPERDRSNPYHPILSL
jgi:hypothetical protein